MTGSGPESPTLYRIGTGKWKGPVEVRFWSGLFRMEHDGSHVGVIGAGSLPVLTGIQMEMSATRPVLDRGTGSDRRKSGSGPVVPSGTGQKSVGCRSA